MWSACLNRHAKSCWGSRHPAIVLGKIELKITIPRKTAKVTEVIAFVVPPLLSLSLPFLPKVEGYYPIYEYIFFFKKKQHSNKNDVQS